MARRVVLLLLVCCVAVSHSRRPDGDYSDSSDMDYPSKAIANATKNGETPQEEDTISDYLFSIFALVAMAAVPLPLLLLVLVATQKTLRVYPAPVLAARAVLWIFLNIVSILNKWEVIYDWTTCPGFLGIIIYYVILANEAFFFWMSMDLWISLRNPFSGLVARAVGGLALAVVVHGLTLALYFMNEFTVSFDSVGLCWIRNDALSLSLFIVPLVLFILLSVLILLWARVRIRRGAASTYKLRMQRLLRIKNYMAGMSVFSVMQMVLLLSLSYSSSSPDVSKDYFSFPLSMLVGVLLNLRGCFDFFLFVLVEKVVALAVASRCFRVQPAVSEPGIGWALRSDIFAFSTISICESVIQLKQENFLYFENHLNHLAEVANSHSATAPGTIERFLFRDYAPQVFRRLREVVYRPPLRMADWSEYILLVRGIVEIPDATKLTCARSPRKVKKRTIRSPFFNLDGLEPLRDDSDYDEMLRERGESFDLRSTARIWLGLPPCTVEVASVEGSEMLSFGGSTDRSDRWSERFGPGLLATARDVEVAAELSNTAAFQGFQRRCLSLGMSILGDAEEFLLGCWTLYKTSPATFTFIPDKTAVALTDDDLKTLMTDFALYRVMLQNYQQAEAIAHPRANASAEEEFVYVAADRRLLVTTVTRHERRRLLAKLPAFYHFVKDHPNTFLAKPYGCHTMIMQGLAVNLVVFYNVMGPVLVDEKFIIDDRVVERIVVGDTEYSRAPDVQRTRSSLIGGTGSWLLSFSPGHEADRDWFVRRLCLDCAFLSSNALYGYSFVVGVEYPPDGSPERVPADPSLEPVVFSGCITDLDAGVARACQFRFGIICWPRSSRQRFSRRARVQRLAEAYADRLQEHVASLFGLW